MPDVVSPNTGAEEPSRVARDVVQVLREVFDLPRIRLPSRFATPTNEKKDKEFCVGLLEKPLTHPWWGDASKLKQRDFFSLAGSLFMLRKLIPLTDSNEEAALQSHRALLTAPPSPPDPEFLDFVRRETATLFPPGWDHTHYLGACARFTPNGSSTWTASRREGGQSADLAGTESTFLSSVLLSKAHAYGRPPPWVHNPGSRPDVRVSAVSEYGKVRVVTVQPVSSARLKPLHEAIYDRLTKEKWCLRGDAKPHRFREFKARKGEVFVSGDYESATDYLDIETTEVILKVILENSKIIPTEIRDQAMDSLRSDLWYGDEDMVSQARGQLMGSYLSFPLLCLRNYLSFRYLIPSESVPVRINGDDIVFRTVPEEAAAWMDGVRYLGLKLSRGKTLVDPCKFSLNSTFFVAGKKVPTLCPVIRAKSLLSRENPPDGSAYLTFMSGWRRSGRKWEHRQRKVGALWLRCRRRAIDCLGRGVWGLGIPAVPSVIHTAGLVRTEAFFNGARRPSVAPPPLAFGPRIRGWRKASAEEVSRVSTRQRREWDRAVGQDMRSSAWAGVRDPSVSESRWEESKSSGMQRAVLGFLSLLRKFSKRVGYPDLYHLPLGNRPVTKKKVCWVPLEWEPRPVEPSFRCPEREFCFREMACWESDW